MPRTHGMTKSPEYIAYKDAKGRCENPSDSAWKDYGARGIKFLFNTFEEFFAALGKRPKGKTLDRVNNDGNYTWGNVRWATKKQQHSNQRRRSISSSNTGCIGVYKRKDNGKFAVRLLTQGKRLHLGNFNTVEEAVKSRNNEIQKQENTNVRSTQFNDRTDLFNECHQASSKVAQDETTEQVFSRKTDRKAYRAEVLGKRTETQRTIAEPEESTLGQKSKARSKASIAARSRA
jgi:hypothetical protein